MFGLVERQLTVALFERAFGFLPAGEPRANALALSLQLGDQRGQIPGSPSALLAFAQPERSGERPQDVRLGEQSGKAALLVDDRQAADAMFGHAFGRFGQGVLRTECLGRVAHDLSDPPFPRRLPLAWFEGTAQADRKRQRCPHVLECEDADDPSCQITHGKVSDATLPHPFERLEHGSVRVDTDRVPAHEGFHVGFHAVLRTVPVVAGSLRSLRRLPSAAPRHGRPISRWL